jgi:hypothetical protein
MKISKTLWSHGTRARMNNEMVFEKLINNYFKAITPAEVFKNIVCHDDLKEIMTRSIFTENRTKTLLLGGPGTAKTLQARYAKR